MRLRDNHEEKLRPTSQKEIDYELEKLIIKAERLPIYLNWYDFRRRSFWEPLRNTLSAVFSHYPDIDGRLTFDLVRQKYNKYIMDSRNKANKKRAKDKIWQIHKNFEPVMKKIKADFYREKDPERAERIIEEYRKVENIITDLEDRVQKWSFIGGIVIYCEHYLPNSGIRYSREDVPNKTLKELYEAEENYRKYNNGGGLKALEQVTDRMNYLAQINEESVDNELRFNEMLEKSKKKSIHERFMEVSEAKKENSEGIKEIYTKEQTVCSLDIIGNRKKDLDLGR